MTWGPFSIMQIADCRPDDLLEAALQAVHAGGTAALDGLAAPIYLTDAEGRLTYFNEACVALAGRRPELGVDRWCVSWRLYEEDGTPLPHEECPLAVSLREQRPVRGGAAICERPDGTRIRVRPFPTPLFDEEGQLTGALNMLAGPSDSEHAEFLQAQATRCRRLARTIGDSVTVAELARMAEEYEDRAGVLGRLH